MRGPEFPPPRKIHLKLRGHHESERDQRAETALPAGQKRHGPYLRLLCERPKRNRFLPGRIFGPNARGGGGEILSPAEKDPVRGPGPEPHRHRVLHPAGGGQR